MQRSKNNRSIFHKRITQPSYSCSLNPMHFNFFKHTASIIREYTCTTTITDREPLAYLPLTEPIPPVSLKSYSNICKPSAEKPANRHLKPLNSSLSHLLLLNHRSHQIWLLPWKPAPLQNLLIHHHPLHQQCHLCHHQLSPIIQTPLMSLRPHRKTSMRLTR